MVKRQINLKLKLKFYKWAKTKKMWFLSLQVI